MYAGIQVMVCRDSTWYSQRIYQDDSKKMFEVFGGKIPECVNRNTMYGDIDKGGFKIVNVNSKLMHSMLNIS